jgi:hypothetical protein
LNYLLRALQLAGGSTEKKKLKKKKKKKKLHFIALDYFAAGGSACKGKLNKQEFNAGGSIGSVAVPQKSDFQPGFPRSV